MLVDTYRTQDYADDPPTPHISVHSPPDAHHDHSIACTPPHSLPHLNDGRAHTLELVYEGHNRRLRGFLDFAGDEEGDESLMSLFDVTVPGSSDGDWYVGVTGSCGGLWQKVSWSAQLKRLADLE